MRALTSSTAYTVTYGRIAKEGKADRIPGEVICMIHNPLTSMTYLLKEQGVDHENTQE